MIPRPNEPALPPARPAAPPRRVFDDYPLAPPALAGAVRGALAVLIPAVVACAFGLTIRGVELSTAGGVALGILWAGAVLGIGDAVSPRLGARGRWARLASGAAAPCALVAGTLSPLGAPHRELARDTPWATNALLWVVVVTAGVALAGALAQAVAPAPREDESVVDRFWRRVLAGFALAGALGALSIVSPGFLVGALVLHLVVAGVSLASLPGDALGRRAARATLAWLELDECVSSAEPR